ncbi:MAG: recombinase RecT [Ruminococcus sp.]
MASKKEMTTPKAEEKALTKVDAFKSLINTKEMVRRLTSACGTKEAAFQFMASMLDLYEGDNYLQNCDPSRVLAECIKAASLNLPLVKSLGYAYVVPYKNTPTFLIGYKGYIQLALRSGQYKCINADCVYEGEEISVDRLSGRLKIYGEKTSDKAVGYFAYFELVNGFEKTFYMTVEDIRAYAKKYSKAYNNGPWQTEFDAMAKKTVIRQLLKYGPMSTEMQMAEELEARATEAAVQTEINEHANRVIIDTTATVPEEPDGKAKPINIDPDTGEVIPDDVPPLPQMEEPDF